MVWNFDIKCLEPFFYILTNTWNLSNSSPVSVVVKRVPSAVASCIWPESKKPHSDLEYRTCSPSVGNSCHRQNQEQSGFLEELITKNRNVQAKDRTHLESCLPKVNSCSLTLVLSSLNGGFSQSIGISLLWGKMRHLGTKMQNMVFILPTGRAPNVLFHPLLRKPLKKVFEVRKSHLKFLKEKCLSFCKSVSRKYKNFDLHCVLFVTLLIITVKLITIISSY